MNIERSDLPDWHFFVSVISASTELCGSDSEIELTKTGETSTMTVTLSPIEHNSVCKMRVKAPTTHVVYVQFVEPTPEVKRALKLNTTTNHPPCVMSFVSLPKTLQSF